VRRTLPPDRANVFLDLLTLETEARQQACAVVDRVCQGVSQMLNGMMPRLGPDLAGRPLGAAYNVP
jgi:hypothetical protein